LSGCNARPSEATLFINSRGWGKIKMGGWELEEWGYVSSILLRNED
jgi:hypothetical protein